MASPEQMRQALERRYVVAENDNPQAAAAKIRAGLEWLRENNIEYEAGGLVELLRPMLEALDKTLHELWRGDTAKPLKVMFVLFLPPGRPLAFAMTVQEKKDACGSRGFYAEAADAREGALAASGGGSSLAAMQRTLMEVAGNYACLMIAAAIGPFYEMRADEGYLKTIETAIAAAVQREYDRQMWPDSQVVMQV